MNKSKGLESDYIFLLLLFATFLWSGHRLFFKPFSPISDSSDGRVPIGVLQYKKNIVKLKSSEVIFWSDTRDETPLYANDSIYTYEDSGADLTFDGGVSLSLGPKTLFKVTPKGESQKLEVKKGIAVFNVKKGSKGLSLDMNGKNIDITGEAASIRINQNAEGSNISLVEGKAKINIGGKKVDVSKNQRLTLNNNQEIGIETIPVELLFPESKADLFFEGRPEVEFKWKNVRALEDLKILIGSDIYFTKIIKEQKVDGMENALMKINTGSYFWKIVGVEKGKSIESNTHVLNIIPEVPPVFYFPQSGDVVNVSKEPTSINPQIVVFKWENQDAPKYDFELFKAGRSFEKGSTDKPQLTFKFTSGGNYAIRVRPIDSRRVNSKYSKLVDFEIKKLEEVEAPQIVNKFHGTRYLTSELKDIGLDLVLEKSDGILNYSVLVTSERDKEEVVFQGENRTGQFQITFPKLGDYLIKVGGKDHFERPLKNGYAKKLSVALTPVELVLPQNSEEIILSRPDEPIPLKWRGVASVKNSGASYQVEISKTKDFQTIVEKLDSLEPEISWTSDELGTFYWRVRVDRETQSDDVYNSFILSKPDPPKKIELPNSINTKVIRRPKKIPKSSSLWNILLAPAYAQDMENVVPLSWPKAEDASKYKIQIFEDKRMGIMLHETETQINSYDWKQGRPGFYYLRIAVVDGWGQTGEFSDLILVRVNLGDGVVLPIDEPELLSPYHTFEPEETFEKPLHFKWSEVEEAESYLFVMAKSLEFDELVFEKKLPKRSSSIQVPREEVRGEGSIRWRVYSIGSEGQRGRSKTRIIRLKPKIVPVVEESGQLVTEKKEPEKYWWLVYATTPGTVDYDLTDGDLKVNANGKILNGANEIYGGYKFNKKWDMAFKGIRTTATFFGDTPFTMHSVALQIGRDFGKYFKIRFGPRMVLMDFFEKSGSTSIEPVGQSLIGLKLNLIGTYQINEKWNFYHDLILGVGGAGGMAFDVIFHYQWKPMWRLGLGAGYKNLTGEVENAKLNIVKKQLLLSIGKRF